jgi:hypothetical protein
MTGLNDDYIISLPKFADIPLAGTPSGTRTLKALESHWIQESNTKFNVGQCGNLKAAIER